MKNIHIIPTDKPSQVFITKSKGFGYDNQMLENNELDCQNQNIYITSDEEIKEGQNYIGDGFNGKNKFKWHKSQVELYPNIKKDIIILTTDQDLIKDGVQSISNEFLEWFVKNTNCKEVEIESYVNGNIERFYDIIIPKEESKTSEKWQEQYPNLKVLDPDGWDRKNYQYSWFEEKITFNEYNKRRSLSTCRGLILKDKLPFPKLVEEQAEYYKNIKLVEKEILPESIWNEEKIEGVKNVIIKHQQENHEEAAKSYAINQPLNKTSHLMGFMKGAKWQLERSYSEEDMIKAWEDGRNGETKTIGSYPFYKTIFKNKTFKEWFKQFNKDRKKWLETNENNESKKY